MSQAAADVSYSCGSCGYPLNLVSSNGVGAKHNKSVKKGLISFPSVDLSRFTQVDEAMDMEKHQRYVVSTLPTRLIQCIKTLQ